MELNWEVIGALAEIFGAAGVIASLIYLGAELRHSSRIAFRQGYMDTFGPWSSFQMEMAKDPELDRIWRHMLTRELQEELDDSDLSRGFHLLMIFFVGAEHGVLQNIDFSDEISQSMWDYKLSNLLSRPLVRRFWTEQGKGFHPDFQSFVGQLLTRDTTENNSPSTEEPIYESDARR